MEFSFKSAKIETGSVFQQIIKKKKQNKLRNVSEINLCLH